MKIFLNFSRQAHDSKNMFEQYIDLCEMQNINLKKNDIEKVVKIMFKYLNENLNCLNKKY